MDVLQKDVAVRWCQNASKLTEPQWKFVEFSQKEFEALRPNRLADLTALAIESNQ